MSKYEIQALTFNGVTKNGDGNKISVAAESGTSHCLDLRFEDLSGDGERSRFGLGSVSFRSLGFCEQLKAECWPLQCKQTCRNLQGLNGH